MFYINKNKTRVTNGQGKEVQLTYGFKQPNSKELKFGEEITKALNATYGEGINPESVLEMKKALELIVNRINNLWDGLSVELWKKEIFREKLVKEGVEALKKSKL